ncbi:hypothetical protein ACFSQ3_01040 [Sphingobacterium corticis]|uniref:Uncharacterized protein n=1 Tax=Sphingobacterium corticis TaxID=1812823 RepID=A0ABW5NEH5_9SPHI
MAKAEESKSKGKVVDLHKRVDVVATDKHPFKKDGDKLKVGVLQVDHLKSKGFIK